MKTIVLSSTNTLQQNVQEMSARYIRASIDYFQKNTGNIHEYIHQARLCFKRLRGLLRIIRYSIGDETYRKENEFFRLTAQRFGRLRDSTAILETIAALSKNQRSTSVKFHLRNLSRNIQNERQQLLNGLRENNLREQTCMELEDAALRIKTWHFDGNPNKMLVKGIGKLYNNARKWYVKAEESMSDSDFHEFRKRAKYLMYVMQTVSPLWPVMANALNGELKDLSAMLGKHHDWVVLGELIKSTPKFPADVKKTLLRSIDSRKDRIGKSALTIGSKMFGQKTACLFETFGMLWKEPIVSTQ